MASKNSKQNSKALDTLIANWRGSVGGDAAAILAASTYAPSASNADRPRSIKQAAYLRNLLRLNRAADVPETATTVECWRVISLALHSLKQSGRKALGRTSPERRVLATYLGVQLEAIDEAAESRKTSRAEIVQAGGLDQDAVQQMIAQAVAQAVAQAMAAMQTHVNGKTDVPVTVQ